MTPETLQRMREAAERVPAPFRGPWKSESDTVFRDSGAYEPVCDIRGWGRLTGTGGLSLSSETAASMQDATAAFIALASPENVLALLDEVERLRDLVCQIEDLSERWTNSVNPVTECRGEELREALS